MIPLLLWVALLVGHISAPGLAHSCDDCSSLKAPVDAGIPSELERSAGVGLPSRLIQRNQPPFVLQIRLQLHLGCKPLDYIEAEVALGGPAGNKILIGLRTPEGSL